MTDTATKAVEHTSFQDRIKAMDEAQLRKLASEEFNVTIDGQLKKDSIVDFLLKTYEVKRQQATILNKESAQLFLDANPNEPIIQVKFMPLDFPHAPIEFFNDGGLGIRGIKNKKKSSLKRLPRFKLVPGETYKLPLLVIKYLEKLTYRDSKPVHDPNTGMITGNIPVIKPRFLLQVILSEEQLQEMSTTL